MSDIAFLDVAKYTSPPLFIYDRLRKKAPQKKVGEKDAVLLNTKEHRTGVIGISAVVYLIFIGVAVYLFFQRGKRVPRTFGRAFWALVMCVFQAPLYIVYAALGLYIPTMDSSLPLPKA